MESQEKKVLALLKKYGKKGITQREAIWEIGCYRLSARILELRKRGYVIDTERQNGKLGIYRLLDEPKGNGLTKLFKKLLNR